jgi:hypothetical protein
MLNDGVNLKSIFITLQRQMIEKLSSGREIIFHPTTKGDFSELNWIEWLRIYLPKRYAMDKAFVIDSNNQFSQQIDLVIYDRQYSPFVFNQGEAIYIPAESVYAVFEVKQDINKTNLLYTSEKIKSVRRLERTSAQITHAGGIISTPKKPFKILGGILTLTSEWAYPFGESFNAIIQQLDDLSQIDIGCILENGSFSICYNDGSATLHKSNSEEALIYLFFTLIDKLQSLGTAPAIDIKAYAKVLDSFK